MKAITLFLQKECLQDTLRKKIMETFLGCRMGEGSMVSILARIV